MVAPADTGPVGRLLGKDAGVLEAHGLDVEHKVLIADGPMLRQIPDLPAAAAGLAPVVDGVCLGPEGAAGLFPDGLRIGSHQDLLPPALQPLTAAAVQQRIVLPMFRSPHKRYPFGERGGPRGLSYSQSVYFSIPRQCRQGFAGEIYREFTCIRRIDSGLRRAYNFWRQGREAGI